MSFFVLYPRKKTKAQSSQGSHTVVRKQRVEPAPQTQGFRLLSLKNVNEGSSGEAESEGSLGSYYALP